MTPPNEKFVYILSQRISKFTNNSQFIVQKLKLMTDIFDNFPSVKEKFQQDRKICLYHNNEISAILSQKTRCIGILKQENVSLIALFHCLILKISVLHFLKQTPKRGSWIQMLQFFSMYVKML